MPPEILYARQINSNPMRGLVTWLMRIGDIRRQSFLHFGTNIFITVAGFGTTMTITHLLETPDVPGGYFLFLSYLGIFTLISNGGLGGAALTLMAGERRDAWFSGYIFLRLLFLAGSILLLILLLPEMKDISGSGMWIWLVMAVILTAPSDIAATYLASSGRSGHVQVSQFMSSLVRILIQIGAVILGFGVFGLAGGMVAGMIAGGVIMIWSLSWRPAWFSLPDLETLVKLSFWSFLAAGGMVVYGNLDAILIGYYAGDAEVGLYRISLQLASFSLFTATALSSILYPKIASWYAGGKAAWVPGTLTRAVSYSLLLAVPVCIGGIITGDLLLYYLYGSPYSAAYVPLTVMLVAQVFYVFVFLWTMALSAFREMKLAALSALSAGIVNLVLNLLLIPVFGITGAAVAILLTILVHTILAGYVLSRFIRISLDFRAIRNIILSALGMSVYILGIRISFPVQHAAVAGFLVLSGALLYFLILIRLERGIESGIKQMIRETGLVLPDWI